MLIDTHCHLDFPDFDNDREEVISRANKNGIKYLINIGSSLKGSGDSVSLAEKHPDVYAACGIHPHDADKTNDESIREIRQMALSKKVVAIGEIGLDYFKNYSSAQNQRKVFVWLNNLAKEINLPVIIHCRQAEDDVLGVLREAKPVRTVVHCFSGDEKFLKECLDLGFFVSFTCNITYKKARSMRDVVKLVPLDRMMLETDSPFLPPEGMRGKRNEPMYVKNLCEEISKIKEVGPDKIAHFTTANAVAFFNLK